MRRTTKRALTQLGVFISVLLTIIFLTQPASIKTNKTLQWSTIRYKPKSSTLPPAHGICPGLSDSSLPALIVSRVSADGDESWLQPLETQYKTCIYTADATPDTISTSPSLQIPINRGHEAMSYLTFLIDNYATLPQAMVFIHGTRFAWHNDDREYDNLHLLQRLNISSALEKSGYHNLRCDWSAGTCDAAGAKPQRSRATAMQATLEPWNARMVSDAALPGALAVLFGGGGGSGGDSLDLESARTLLGRSDPLRAQCCAQFVVGRDAVYAHSKAEYVALRQWLLETAPSDDRVSGRILSYVWHILFLAPAATLVHDTLDGAVSLDRLNHVACPSAQECYCRLYGRCALDGCDGPGRCHGQYSIPPLYKLPDDWAARHP